MLQCVAMSAVCLFVKAAAFRRVAIEIKLAYSDSVTCSNNQFCRNCNYYEFETIQHCGGMTTASPKTGLRCLVFGAYQPEWGSLVKIDGEQHHAVTLSATSDSAAEKLCFSRPPSPRDKP